MKKLLFSMLLLFVGVNMHAHLFGTHADDALEWHRVRTA